MLDKIFNRDDNTADDKEKQIQETIKNLTEQIGSLRQELQAKNTQIESLQDQAKTGAQSATATATQQAQELQHQIDTLKRQLNAAQVSGQSVNEASQAAQKQILDLQNKLNEANADKDKQLSDLQAKLAASASAAGATAPAAAQAAAVSETAQAASLAVGGQAWVTKEGGMNLRMRSGAGLEHGVLGSLPPGTAMTLLDGPQSADNYSWWHIRTSDGREGWVAGQDLRPFKD